MSSSEIALPESNETVCKSAKVLAKEAKRKEKLEKFKQKQEKKLTEQVTSNPNKVKKEVTEKKPKITYDFNTKAGEKKVVTNPLPDSYNPKYVETVWYDWWEKSGFFKPEYNIKLGLKEKFVTVFPPPNVTGVLHLGHALTSAIQDTIIRWHRMHGKSTLWIPGCDHSGIATQVVVEKKIAREKNLSRHDIGREKFLEEVWKFKNEKGDYIYNQMKLLGISTDWDRVAFTMDDKRCKAVNTAFVKLYEQELIYRGNYLVNWSFALRSAISDIEVDKLELTKRKLLNVPNYKEKIEFGLLVYFAYQICDSNEKITIATTRIETILGDTAVAVNPTDERFKHLHGKFVKHPFLNKKLPIITDTYVDISFGTGALKVTPAHDPNDFNLGKKHNLPFVNIFTDNGNILEGFGEFSGMKRYDARKAILEALKNKNLLIDIKEHAMVLPICNRSKDVIEPMLKVQWYVKCENIAKRACDAVRNDELKIYPEQYKKTWFHWLENIHDWCISRQLWWGHRLPIYFVKTNDKSTDLNNIPHDNRWIAALSEKEAKEKAVKKFNLKLENIILEQDEDVLDTWFSSGLFPFSTMGWPDNTDDMKNFYPGNLLETGVDIIFFWVARMVMLGLQLTDKLPFTEIYLHSIVRDSHGRKMSKSLGNVIDPLYVINGISLEDLNKSLINSNLDPKEIDKAISAQKKDFKDGIPECGTDALRFGLLAYCSQGKDINLDIKRIEGYRFFCNKLWNAFKLILKSLDVDFVPLKNETLTGKESEIDLWILSKIISASSEINKSIKNYNFLNATTSIYNFWLYEFCDIYLEYIKNVLQFGNEDSKFSVRQTLYTCAHNGLRLLHPFMPFLTEELYQRLPKRPNCKIPSIMVEKFPEKFDWHQNLDLEKKMDLVKDFIHKVRSLRFVCNLNKKKCKLFIKYDTTKVEIKQFFPLIQVLTYSSKITIVDKAPIDSKIVDITDHLKAFLVLDDVKKVESV